MPNKIDKLFCSNVLLPSGWAENKVIEVDAAGNIDSISTGEPRACVIAGGTVIPGIPNLHSHAFQRAMAGLAEVAGPAEDSFWTWRQVLYKFLQQLMPDDVEAIAAQLYVEMLEAGYTAVGEFHYLHHDLKGKHYADIAELSGRVLNAASQTGIGITHLPVLYAHSGFGSQEPNSGQARFINSVDELLSIAEKIQTQYRDNPQVAIGVAPHSLRAVTLAELTAVTQGIKQLNTRAPIHIHIAEQTKEVDDCLAWSGQRPVEWLFNNSTVDHDWCLVHATHINKDELNNIVASKAVAGLCPVTEANLGDGIFPALEFVKSHGVFGIGSDSHISVSPVEELRWLEYTQRLILRSRNLLTETNMSTGLSLFTNACKGGAQALGRNIGEIAVGKRADFVVLDNEHPLLLGRQNDLLLDSWVFSGNRASVRDVYVGGQQVVVGGKHFQREKITEEFSIRMRKLMQ